MSNQPELPKKIRYKYVMDDSLRKSWMRTTVFYVLIIASKLCYR